MAERTVAVASTVGLHARPAALFVQAVARQPMEITIGRPGGEPVDAASILQVMTLGVGHGEEVTLRADGPGAEVALSALAELLGRDLDAEG